MAKKKVEQDVRDDPRYHDTRRLLRKYRDVTWSLELSVQRLRSQFHVEYGTNIEDFLDTVYQAGANLGGTELEHHTQCIERSHKMLMLVQNAVELLRTRHKKGESYYWILYYAYMSPQKLKNADEIIEALRPHIRDISFSTYYRLSKEAVEALSSILWGFTSKDTLDILEKLLPLWHPNLTGKVHLCHSHVKYGWQLLLPPILKTLLFSSLKENNLLFYSLYGIPFCYLSRGILNQLSSSTKDSKNSGISFTVTQIG